MNTREKLIETADWLDQQGMTQQADIIDSILKKTAGSGSAYDILMKKVAPIMDTVNTIVETESQMQRHQQGEQVRAQLQDVCRFISEAMVQLQQRQQ